MAYLCASGVEPAPRDAGPREQCPCIKAVGPPQHDLTPTATQQQLVTSSTTRVGGGLQGHSAGWRQMHFIPYAVRRCRCMPRNQCTNECRRESAAAFCSWTTRASDASMKLKTAKPDGHSSMTSDTTLVALACPGSCHRRNIDIAYGQWHI